MPYIVMPYAKSYVNIFSILHQSHTLLTLLMMINGYLLQITFLRLLRAHSHTFCAHSSRLLSLSIHLPRLRKNKIQKRMRLSKVCSEKTPNWQSLIKGEKSFAVLPHRRSQMMRLACRQSIWKGVLRSVPVKCQNNSQAKEKGVENWWK